MRYSKTTITVLLVGVLMLNGCMLKRIFSDDESGGMHSDMHSEMMHESGDE